jgi:hypothetical protein
MKNELIEITKDFAEVGIDTVIEEGFLRDIPIFGTLINISRCAKAIPDLIFAAKVKKFLFKISEVEEKKRVAFQIKLQCDKKLADEAGQLALFSIDSVESLAKATLIGIVFREYVLGKIDFDELKKLMFAIEKSYYDHLITLVRFVEKPINGICCDIQSLVGAGLAKQKEVSLPEMVDQLEKRDRGFFNMGESPNYLPTELGRLFGQLVAEIIE